MDEKDVILQLKANLFDTEEFHTVRSRNIQSIIIKAHSHIQRLLGANQTKLLLNEQLLQRYPNLYSAEVGLIEKEPFFNGERLSSFYADGQNFIILENKAKQIIDSPFLLVLKMHHSNLFKGYYVIGFLQYPNFKEDTIIDIHKTFAKYFLITFNQFQQNLQYKQNKWLFRLSEHLQPIDNTIDVLAKTYTSLSRVYSTIEYRFFMSQEYESTALPLYVLDHSEYKSSSLMNAFIKNKIVITQSTCSNETVLYAPLGGEQGVYGIIELTIPFLIKLTRSELTFIEKISQIVGRAVEKTTLYQSSKELVTNLQSINAASRQINKHLDVESISFHIKKHVFATCQPEELGIILCSEASTHPSDSYYVSEQSTNFFHSLSSQRYIQELYRLVLDSKDSYLSGNFTEKNPNSPFNSIMIIPMWNEASIFGMIIICHTDPYYFTFNKYKFIQSFVQHASLAYTNSMLKDQLKKAAITDYLTNLYLRSHLDEQIKKHLEEDDGGSFLLFDVDNFKAINDSYGHYIGDQVLIQIANIIAEEVSGLGIAARWGGDEFAVYVYEGNKNYAMKVANEIRKKVKQQTRPNVSLSLGVTIWKKEQKLSIEKLFIKADMALYDAKAKGKNCVVFN